MNVLSGIRVLDLTRVVSGPFCTMILGDLGAEVVKIEEPRSGDDSRAFGPPFVGGESTYFMSVNRHKRSCAIDLKSPRGLALLKSMLPHFDVLVENFRPDTMARLGLGDDELLRLHPGLIRCSISGFGTAGPDADRPGYDLILQGESGVMDITGAADGPPTKVGTSIADLVTGLYGAQAVLAALVKKQREGSGCRVNISMLDSLASLLTFNAGSYFATGRSPVRRGNEHPSIYPYETFRAADGWINVGVANDKFWRLFCAATGDETLAADPAFDTAPKRVAARDALRPRLETLFVTRTRAQWIACLGEAGVPCGAIRTVAEVCEAEQLTARGMVGEIEHPSAGRLRSVMTPFRFEDQPPELRAPPPRLGEHTDAVLGELCGLSAAELLQLRAEGVTR